MILEKNLEKWTENHKFNEQNDHTPNMSTKMATKTQIEQTQQRLIRNVAKPLVDFEIPIGRH